MTRRPDPLQLIETAGEDLGRRAGRQGLRLGELAALGGGSFFATMGVGLFTVGMDDSWQFIAGVGWGIVVGLVWLWALTVDRR